MHTFRITLTILFLFLDFSCLVDLGVNRNIRDGFFSLLRGFDWEYDTFRMDIILHANFHHFYPIFKVWWNQTLKPKIKENRSQTDTESGRHRLGHNSKKKVFGV